MNTKEPDFFLASTESVSFRGPRKCWIETRIDGELRNDYLSIRIDPHATDPRTGEKIERIVVAGRCGTTDLSKLPLNLYIAKIKDSDILKTKRCNSESIEVVASGDAYRTEEEANQNLDEV